MSSSYEVTFFILYKFRNGTRLMNKEIIRELFGAEILKGDSFSWLTSCNLEIDSCGKTGIQKQLVYHIHEIMSKLKTILMK